jgi:hypothetical protein
MASATSADDKEPLKESEAMTIFFIGMFSGDEVQLYAANITKKGQHFC